MGWGWSLEDDMGLEICNGDASCTGAPGKFILFSVS